MPKLIAALCLALCAASPAQPAADAPDAAVALDVLALERLVLQDCGSCHGLNRKGGLGPDLRARSLSHWTPEDLAHLILDGIPGTAMPPWRPLMSEREAQWIAHYLLSTE